MSDIFKSQMMEKATDFCKNFGHLVSQKRKASNLTQEQLAMHCGVGRKFIIDVEDGKPTTQLGLCLLVAYSLKINITDIYNQSNAFSSQQDMLAPDSYLMPYCDDEELPSSKPFK